MPIINEKIGLIILNTKKMKLRNWLKYMFVVVSCSPLASSFAEATVYNVTDFGAKGDTVTDNTVFIQNTIDACAKTGGEVYFPAGVFLTSTLVLKSNVTLHVSAGATILAQDRIAKYPEMEAGFRFYGDQWAKYSLIFCKGMENVTIKGDGIIDGQGASFIADNNESKRYKDRPFLLWFIDCRNVSVQHIQLRNSAFWMQYYLACENVFINAIKVWNHSNKNNDMIDIDGCKNVVISNVIGDSDDDGITIKSTTPRLSENITIANCVISSHCNAIKFGTESTGGFKKVIVTGCVIKPSKRRTVIFGKPDGISGIALETVDGGMLEDICIDNIVIEGPQVPVFVRLGNRARKYMDGAEPPSIGSIRNIIMSNIIATGGDGTGCSLTGIEKMPIENITLRDISIEINGTNLPDSLYNVHDKEAAYPEATMFGILPAYGFYIKHATNVKLLNVTTRYKGNEERPGILANNIDGFIADGLTIQSSSLTKASLYMFNSRNGILRNCIRDYSSRAFLFKDKYCKNIRLN